MEEGPRLHYQEQVLQGLLELRKAWNLQEAQLVVEKKDEEVLYFANTTN